jgi:hypothetical protein
VALDWGRKDEFIRDDVQEEPRSAHSRRFYGAVLRKFGQFREERKATEVDDQNV